ncbi:glutaminase DH11.1, putative [Brugia malayi]|uniref:glutaminase n=2 Tax=Brugia malayi TaxID=6279 RepID=A0A0H5SM99_BRUMA|nr:glutaminase DH11.1, putative [Brugia malayi]CRZ24842.1 BMA-GLNA-1 [Brugia malayi]VIO93313.1 glutaminase DH11.1, putative [Brugia malayi]
MYSGTPINVLRTKYRLAEEQRHKNCEAMEGDEYKCASAAVDSVSKILKNNRKSSITRLLNDTAKGLKHVYQLSHPSQEDLTYDLFKCSKKPEEASLGKLLSVLRSFGIREDDPRLKHTIEKMHEYELQIEDDCDTRHCLLNKKQFKECIRPSINLIAQTLRNDLIIPCWGEFTAKIKEIFDECANIHEGKVANYIPQLARVDPKKWGLSICTIDGQRVSYGDARVPFCFQSISKAFNYAIVASDLGADFVHNYVGHEPSGRLFNEICLDCNGKPHNPLINAGAIIVTSLLKMGHKMADRYDFVLTQYRKLAGGGYIGFNNATFLSERDTADRNYALSYYMKENNCFPGSISLRDELDFYFQLCSLETTCESAAVMAATLANGGVCPLTNEICISARPCRDVLSLMYSCGMYDYSGQFAFQVGLPAKSGVSGAMVVVVPNLMGICIWSPPLDKMGNSVRGVSFCKKMIETFNFHNYDSLLHADTKKIDPRKRGVPNESELILEMMFATKKGNIDDVRRMFLGGIDLNMSDYDGRTPLHLAASEGQSLMVDFFLDIAHVNPLVRDRWNRTAYDDALSFGFTKIAEKIKSYMDKISGGFVPITIPPEKARQLLPENGDILINLPEEADEWEKELRIVVDRLSYFDHSNDCGSSPGIAENGDGAFDILEKSSEGNNGPSALDAESITDGAGGQIDLNMKISS